MSTPASAPGPTAPGPTASVPTASVPTAPVPTDRVPTGSASAVARITPGSGPDAAAVPPVRAPRVVLQHPQALPEAAVAATTALLGATPTRLGPRRADWSLMATAPQPSVAALRALGETHHVDTALIPTVRRLEDFRVIAFDMDSTVITIECIDEIAAYAGLKAQVAAITEATMRGEITDFSESLRRRVALLAGLPATVLDQVYEERLGLSPGIETLLAATRAAGLHQILVSGGFTTFTDRLKLRLGFDETRANALEIADGRLTGRVLGDIVDAEAKRATVAAACAALGVGSDRAIVVGDGANDLKMMAIAGLSVAYHAKPVVRAQTDQALNVCGLDAILAFVDEPVD